MSAVANVRNRPRIDNRVHSVIAGTRVAARAGATEIPVINPATEQTISVLQEADAGEVDAAVRAARDAFDRGAWPRLPLDDRKDILYRIRDLMRERSDELAYLECL